MSPPPTNGPPTSLLNLDLRPSGSANKHGAPAITVAFQLVNTEYWRTELKTTAAVNPPCARITVAQGMDNAGKCTASPKRGFEIVFGGKHKVGTPGEKKKFSSARQRLVAAGVFTGCAAVRRRDTAGRRRRGCC